MQHPAGGRGRVSGVGGSRIRAEALRVDDDDDEAESSAHVRNLTMCAYVGRENWGCAAWRLSLLLVNLIH